MAWKGHGQKWVVYTQDFHLCNGEFQKSPALMIPGEDHPYQMELPKVHIPVIPIICCETLKNLLLSVSHSSVKEIMKAHRIKNVLVTVPGT